MKNKDNANTRDQQAFREIAEAFALLKANSDYIPARYYNDISDIEASWFVTDAQPFASPDMLRKILPLIFAHQHTTQETEDEEVRDEDAAADDEDDGDSEAWDFSKPFTFEPIEPTLAREEAEPGSLVLIRCGAAIAIVPYDGQQEYLGTIWEVADTWDLIKEEENALLEQAAVVEEAAQPAPAQPSPKEENNAASPSPANRFDVPSQFNALADRLAANIQDDELLNDFIRLAFAIADEPDKLNRESLALTVANQAYTRTCEFSARLDDILRNTPPA